jgi:hypothetical protein
MLDEPNKSCLNLVMRSQAFSADFQTPPKLLAAHIKNSLNMGILKIPFVAISKSYFDHMIGGVSLTM